MVSILIPVWNGETLLKKHFDSVLSASKNKDNKIEEIIVVNDASTDDSLGYLKRLQKNYKINLINHKVNQGFIRTVNEGFKIAKGEYICLLNQDVSVEVDFCKSAIEHFKNDRVFAVSFHELGYGYAVAKLKDGFLEHKAANEKDEIHDSFWASGGTAMFNKKIWEELGGFDDKLYHPFYSEDLDVSYRAQKRGYIVLWESKSRVIHKHESIINKSNFNNNYLLMIKQRNYLLWHWKNLTSRKLIIEHILGLVKRIILHPGYIKVLFWAFPKIFIVLKRRKKELRDQKVSDEDIFAKFAPLFTK